jgi:PhnB protein
MAQVAPIPPGYHSVTPYLIVDGAANALDFYTRAFGAKEVMRVPMPGGRLAHAEILLGDSHVMLADEFPEMDCRSPRSYGGTPVSLMLYVPDVDTLAAQAVAAGVTVVRPLADQFYGDRSITVTDPFGHQWTLATHVEDVSPEEIDRRMKAMSPSADCSPSA